MRNLGHGVGGEDQEKVVELELGAASSWELGAAGSRSQS